MTAALVLLGVLAGAVLGVFAHREFSAPGPGIEALEEELRYARERVASLEQRLTRYRKHTVSMAEWREGRGR